MLLLIFVRKRLQNITKRFPEQEISSTVLFGDIKYTNQPAFKTGEPMKSFAC